MFYNGKDEYYNKMFTKGKWYTTSWMAGDGHHSTLAGATSNCGKFVLYGYDNLGLFMSVVPPEGHDMYQCTYTFPTQAAAKAFASFMCGSGEQSMWEWRGCEDLHPVYDYQKGHTTFLQRDAE